MHDSVTRLAALDDGHPGDPLMTLAQAKRALGIAHREQAVRIVSSGAVPSVLVMIPTWTGPRRCVRRSDLAAYAQSYGLTLREHA